MKKEKKQSEQEKLDMTLFLKGSILSPIENLDKNVSKLKDPKIIAVLAGFLTLATMVLNLLATMIGSIFVKNCDFWTGKCKTQITFDKIGNLDYIDLIFKGLLKYAIIIFAIAGVYYIGSLIVKKNSNYFKNLAIVSTGLIPAIVMNLFVGPILGIFYSPLNLFAVTLGNVYTILILTFAMKKELKIDNYDKLVMYNGFIFMFSYIVYYIIITASVFS